MQKVEPVLDVIQKERQMERHTGEPCAEKVASTVRREAVGKVPKGNSLAANSTMERTAKPGEGQNDGQETAAIHGGLQVSTIAHPQKNTSCSDRDRPPVPDQNTTHPSGCTLFFPFRGLVIGANHTSMTRGILIRVFEEGPQKTYSMGDISTLRWKKTGHRTHPWRLNILLFLKVKQVQ